MWDPSRNTAMMPMVNRIFLRRSGILNELTKAFSIVRRFLERRSSENLSLQAEDLYGASCLLDLALGGGRDRVHPDGQGLVQLAFPQDLHRGALPGHASAPEQLWRDLRATLEGIGQAHPVGALGDHPADVRAVLLDQGVADPEQPEPADRRLLILRSVDDRTDLGAPKLRHRPPPGRTGPFWRPWPLRRRPHLPPSAAERSPRHRGRASGRSPPAA